MRIRDIDIQLKDGRSAVIRNAVETDIPGMLYCRKIAAEETNFVMRYPEEFNSYTYDGERELFKQINASRDDAMLVCVIDGIVTGMGQITFGKLIKNKHRAEVGIAILSAFWRQGIGNRMMEVLTELAVKHKGITQLELTVMEGNVRAINLYEKLGYKKVAIHPYAMRLKDGTFLSEITMIKPMENIIDLSEYGIE